MRRLAIQSCLPWLGESRLPNAMSRGRRDVVPERGVWLGSRVGRRACRLCCLAPGSPPCYASPAGPVDAACVMRSLAWLRASGLLVPARRRAAASDLLLSRWVRAWWRGVHPGVLLYIWPWLPLLRLLRLCVRVARSGVAACCWRARASAPVPGRACVCSWSESVLAVHWASARRLAMRTLGRPSVAPFL